MVKYKTLKCALLVVTFSWHFFIYYYAGSLKKMEETQLWGPLRGPGYQEVTWCIRRRQGIYKTLSCFLQEKAGPLDSQSPECIAKRKASTKQMKLQRPLTGIFILMPQKGAMMMMIQGASFQILKETHTLRINDVIFRVFLTYVV